MGFKSLNYRVTGQSLSPGFNHSAKRYCDAQPAEYCISHDADKRPKPMYEMFQHWNVPVHDCMILKRFLQFLPKE
jgi:hypothetical protein